MSTTGEGVGAGGMIMTLPHELVEEILVLCDPVDVARVAMSCRKMYGIVYGGVPGQGEERRRGRKTFWRTLYLAQPLDDLRACVDRLGLPRVVTPSQSSSQLDLEDDGGIDWQDELQKVIRARSVVSDVRLCRDERELGEVLKTFLGLVEWVPPVHGREGDLAKNLVWVPVVLKDFLDVIEKGVPRSSSTSRDDQEEPRRLWRVSPISGWSEQTRQRYAQLRTLYGLTRSDLTRRARVESRAYVYDMRNYTAEDEYGPLRDGGKYVDWIHVQKIHHVMSMHVVWDSVKLLVESDVFGGEGDVSGRDGFQYTIYPMSMPFTQTLVPRREGEEDGGVRGVPPVEVLGESNDELPEGSDWAGIEGAWTVCFCFCDHRELIAYNASEDANGQLDTSCFEEEDFIEVFRRLEVNLHVTRVANDPEHPGRPVIGFVGEMQAPSTSTMYGCVQLTDDKHIKWQFYSGEMGANAIWSSVGVQIGGAGSSFGVLGAWTTVFHDHEDPVGPFWMQKK